MLAARHRLADKLVYSKVKGRLGGRFRVGVSGAAPLARDVIEFFHTLDVLILEAYGLTECTTGATGNRPGSFRFGTVGKPLPGVELRIAEDGEILIRSDTVFAGYYKDEPATREVLGEDGWLRTGDIGSLDDDGYLTVVDERTLRFTDNGQPPRYPFGTSIALAPFAAVFSGFPHAEQVGAKTIRVNAHDNRSGRPSEWRRSGDSGQGGEKRAHAV